MQNTLKLGAFGASLLLGSFFTSPSVQAEEVLKTDPIMVEGTVLFNPGRASYEVGDEAMAASPYGDSADYLASLPGVTASRLGGHGFEPFIRGQSKSQLNIVNDNSYAFGACPGRMDPPTSYIHLQPQDEVTIVRGYQSVLNGFGGTGGSVIVKQNAPDINSEDVQTTGLIQGGYDSNHEMWESGANVTSGTSAGYVSAYASYKEAKNYEDGNGKEVRSAFKEGTTGFKLGYTPGDAHLYAAVDYHRIDDALFAGAGMDSPLSKNVTYKAGLETALDHDVFHTLHVSGYASLADHIMDNYSLRTPTGMSMRATPESNTYGFKLESDMTIMNRLVTALAEWRRNTRASAMPNVTVDELALAAETTYDLGIKNRLVTGVRYDYVHADYDKAGDPQTGMTTRTADDVYQQFYGTTSSPQEEHNLGGLVRLEHDYTSQTMLYTGFSRAVRTADVIERGLANYMGMGGAMSWVGNPDINPEQHHQFDVGFDTQQADVFLSGSAYANVVKDYILRDSARAQGGVAADLPNADIYRNIDAFLGGFELNGTWDVADDMQLFGDMTYTYGTNIDSGDALAQIPPLQGKIGLDWQAVDHFGVRTTMRWATKQTRVDTDTATGSGRDVGKTAGYAVFDVEGTLTDFEPATLNFGITNVLDADYANHLNLSNAYDATEVQVEEPGRSFYVKLSVPF